jgi:predicted branched-subunit amino acid permease
LPASRVETAASFTRDGMLLGARLAIPVLPGLVFYCMAFGAAAAHTGLSAIEAVSMSGLVYAGAAQMLSLELWREVWTPGALATVAIVTATVNARMILMGASIQPWIRALPGGWQAVNLFFLTDANWLIATRYHAGGGRDLGVLFGAGIVIWAVWAAATLPGFFAGALIRDPRMFALDLVMPVFFAVLIVPLWRGIRASALPWATAAIMATLTQAVVPGYAFIVVGALSGAIAGAVFGERR